MILFFLLIDIVLIVDYEEQFLLDKSGDYLFFSFYYLHPMASSTKALEHFVCHFCFDKFRDYSSLISHFSDRHSKVPTKRNEETPRLPRLNQTDREMLDMLRLHRCNGTSILRRPKDTVNSYLQIPLSMDSIIPTKQAPFDDSICHTTNSLLLTNNPIEVENVSNPLNTKALASYHTYKYSRREQKKFYASVKRARLKKHNPTSRKTRSNSLIFDQRHFFIILPTIISSRQRLNTNSSNSYPLIFDPNFNSLVQKSTNRLLENYFSPINSSFQLLHSIASQEFQTIVNSNDNEHQVSYTAFSFLHLLRQTMADYSIHLQRTFKRNYFQSFQPQNSHTPIASKIPRHEPSISSSSQIQIENTHHRAQTPIARVAPPAPVMNNFVFVEQDHADEQSDSMVIDHQPSTDPPNMEPTTTPFISVTGEENSIGTQSPIILREQKIEPIQFDEPSFPIEKARIRVINGPNRNKKPLSSRKKLSTTSEHKTDENSLVKSTRMSTRQNAVKTETITDLPLTFETTPVILPSTQIAKEWLIHTVFYRCHACSHEQFFVVWSRECINLHISSHHANMQENFKQRQSNFLTHKGRGLKIFQHYLKWQQPWSEKQIEQIFKLSTK